MQTLRLIDAGDAAPMRQQLEELAQRWRRYEATTIDQAISPTDDMFGGNASYYVRSGRTALELITEAMMLTGRTQFTQVLDAPCGGGRVTRHLKAFFPEATISVSDIEPAKQAFVVAQFGAQPYAASADFTAAPQAKFDLIFVGSLLTHLPADLYRRAVDYFIRALAPGGILIVTTHGRTAAQLARKAPDRLTRWRHLAATGLRLPLRGFAYVGSWRMRLRSGVRYGGSFNTASWAASLIERRQDARLLGFKERGWMDLQDVLIVQKNQ